MRDIACGGDVSRFRENFTRQNTRSESSSDAANHVPKEEMYIGLIKPTSTLLNLLLFLLIHEDA